MPAFALGGAAATLVGQSLGAGQPARARRAAWAATAIDMVFMLLAAAFVIQGRLTAGWFETGRWKKIRG